MIAAVVLAAGSSRRFGDSDKLAAGLGGRPLLTWAVTSALAAGLDQVVVVTAGSHPPLPSGVRVVHNPAASQGQATSVRAGIRACAGYRAVVIGLGDQPFVQSQIWRTLALSPWPIAVATYRGWRGNPVKLDASVWPLLPGWGDFGARVVMAARPDLVGEVGCPGYSADIDTLEDLRRWNWSTTSPSSSRPAKPGRS